MINLKAAKAFGLAAVFVALVQHLAVPGLRSRAFLSTATHGHRRKAQVFRPRYAVPKASNSKLNAAIQAGSTRCDIPTKMAQKHKTGHRKIMDSSALSTARNAYIRPGFPRYFVLVTTARERSTLRSPPQ